MRECSSIAPLPLAGRGRGWGSQAPKRETPYCLLTFQMVPLPSSEK